MEISQETSLYLKQAKMSCFSFYLFCFFFFKIREQEGGTSPPQGKSWLQWERGGDSERG
jgi:hypothetical protein